MRGDQNPPPDRTSELTLPVRRGIGIAALVLLVATIATGGATSPALPLLAAILVVIVRYAQTPVELAAPIVAAFIVATAEAFLGDGGRAGAFAGLVLAAATVPGWIWRRDRRHAAARLAQLDEILAQVARERRGPAEAAAAELADLERALAAVADRLGAALAMLWDVDAHKGSASVRAASRPRTRYTVRLHGDPLGWVWEQGMRLRLDPPPRWADSRLIIVADRIRRDEDHGLLLTLSFEPASLPVEDTAFEQAALYIRGLVALYDERASADRGQRRVEALIGGVRRIPGDLDLPTLAHELCRTAMDTTDATGAAFGIWESDHGRVLATAGDDGGPARDTEFSPPGSELALAVRAGSMLVRDAASWSLDRSCLASPDELWIRKPRAMAVLPLHHPDGIVGVLAVWSATRPVLDADALELLHALAPYAAMHIQHARAFGELRHTAERDPLTQLRNRRSFDEVFTNEAARFARYGRPLSLMILDLDHFKAINDRFGHEAGDDVLVRVARIIEAGIRDSDTAARFGGEEFVVLLPETGIAAALEVAERIRAAVADADITGNGGPIPIRVSIGVSCCPGQATHPSELIGSADTALYEAKASGRDRVVPARN